MPGNFRARFWTVLGATSIAFHLWLIFAGLVPNLVSRPLHMALALPWALLWASPGRRPGPLTWGICLAGVAACVWVAWNSTALGDQYGSLSGALQNTIAIVLLGSAIFMARRAVGWPLPSLAMIALLTSRTGCVLR